MGLAIKIVLLLVFAAVTALIVFSILFFLRPIATTVWFRRNALRRAGLRKTKLTTTVGGQIVWHGGAGPLLVLLHGAGDQAGTWYKVAPELKRHFQLVIPDLAGHGESDPVAGVLSLGTLLTALEQVLDAKPWRDAPLVFAGNSLGAWMAMLYAQKHPQRVTRVILIDGGPSRAYRKLASCQRTAKRLGARSMPCSILPRLAGRILSSMIWSASRIRSDFAAAGCRRRRLCRNTCSMTNWQISSCRSISSGVPPIASCRWIMRRSCNRSFRIAR
jgi:pimeloyl-ACP methyl ester carboxylesterase